MFLVIIKGTKIGTVFSLDREGIYVIGRGEECDIKILDPMISRRHCQIERTRNNDFYIKDLKSTNKTFVNKKVIEDLVELKAGDMIGIGDTVLLFTDQKDIPIKSVADLERLRVNQTMRIDLPVDKN